MASRVTRNIFGALATGANAALLKNMALRDEQRQYELGRQRWHDEEAERRKLQLDYGVEDYGIRRGREQQEYDLGLSRDEGEYGVKRSRALSEYKENQALADIERERMINTGALVGKEINDPRYAHRTIAKAWGLPDIPDMDQRQLEHDLKRAQIDYYNNRALTNQDSKVATSAGGKSGYQSAVQITGMIEKLEQMRKTGVDPVTGEKIELDDKSKLWLDQTINNLRRHLDEQLTLESQQGATTTDLVKWAQQTAAQLTGNKTTQAAPEPASPIAASAFNPVLPTAVQSLNPYPPTQNASMPFTPEDMAILKRWVDTGK